jgi:type II secretory pathway pseudopilin PulG
MATGRIIKKYFSEKFFRSGSLLLEILVVIGVFAIISPLVAQIVVTGFNTDKWSIENSAALNLADATIKATENISFEQWQNIYNLGKTATDHYYPDTVGAPWIVSSGDEIVNVDGRSYTRYFTVTNVCRDNTTKAIIAATPPCAAGASDDPSTQKISVTVSWAEGILTKDTYLTRWRNKLCHQTNWGNIGSGPANCPSNAYESATDIDTTTLPGSITLQAN